MAYKKLTRRSYKIIKTTIWFLPVCELIDMQVVKHYKTWSSHISHISYTSHLVAIPYITNTPCKNKLDTSNLLIDYFTWLTRAMLKNGSYLLKSTTLILELPKSCCKSDDNYSGRYKHPPAACVEQATVEPVSWMWSCKVGLGRFNPTIPRHQELHEKKLAPKHQRPQQYCCVLLV
jgi:hypothetical protein